MSRSSPAALERLLGAADSSARESAWSEFLDEYNRLILHGARSLGGPQDAVMDRYAFVLERLRRDDFARLRGYAADGRGKFTTWLLVVVRRLCLDEARSRYGRQRGGSPELHRQRREVADLVAVEFDPDLLETAGPSPEQAARMSDLRERLRGAVEQLDSRERLMLRLRYHDEVAVAEMARILSFPNVFHVYRRLNHVLEKLRDALRDAGVEDARP